MIFIALGANLPSQHGTPRQTLMKAVEALKEKGIKVLAVSPIYLTAPIPVSNQPWYHNAVALVKTHLLPVDLLRTLQDIEVDFGRIRTTRNAARVLDLDLIDYQGKVIDERDLELPHPRMADRAFVLYPLRDIAPDWRHPVSRSRIDDLIAKLPKDQELRLAQSPLIMGVVNVTPDSFSDGGHHQHTDAALRHARHLIAEGASIVDIGGESTRPGSEPVDVDEELRRVIPVVEGLKNCGARISVDTRRADVMEAAIQAGAHIINDITALEGDHRSLEVVAASRVSVCLMHMKGTPKTMQDNPVYQDVVAEVADYLSERVRICEEAGIRRERIMIDPGIGFGKSLDHNMALLSRLERFRDIGVPVLLGASRKSYISGLCGHDIPVDQRLGGSLAAVAAAHKANLQIVRVHDVAATKQFLDVLQQICV